MYSLLELTARFAAGQVTCGSGEVCDPNLPVAQTNGAQLRTGLEVVFGVAAAVAVLMIVIAGFRFVTAQGNPQETAKAKSTIIYAIVGLMVALTAEGIVA
ncbi:MAG TPA: hypothetical protein VM535_02015, partial [Candidatus Saccharimonadales bacterium]|nr:hypothetical protein [Candidatus Saccharimonadales bacterium]